jgi:hypothetical protein
MEIFNYLKKWDKIDMFIKTTGWPGNTKKNRYCPVQNGTYGQPSHTISRGAGGGAVLAAYVSVGNTSLECSVLECGQVYSMLCCLLVGTSHSDCITMMYTVFSQL